MLLLVQELRIYTLVIFENDWCVTKNVSVMFFKAYLFLGKYSKNKMGFLFSAIIAVSQAIVVNLMDEYCFLT